MALPRCGPSGRWGLVVVRGSAPLGCVAAVADVAADGGRVYAVHAGLVVDVNCGRVVEVPLDLGQLFVGAEAVVALLAHRCGRGECVTGASFSVCGEGLALFALPREMGSAVIRGMRL